MPSVGVGRDPLLELPERVANGPPDELRAAAASRRRDLFELRCYMIIDLDQQLFHIEQYMDGGWVRQGASPFPPDTSRHPMGPVGLALS